MTDIVIAEPMIEPLTRVQAKANLRSTSSAEDTLVDAIIAGARRHAESFVGRKLVQQTRRLYLDCFPTRIKLLCAPLRAVQSVQYLDTAGAVQTVATTVYRVDKASEPGVITLDDGQVWPVSRPVRNAVMVNYTAGHLAPFTADSATDVITAAGHGLANGDQTPVSTIGGTLPIGLVAAVNYYVVNATTDTLKLSLTSGGAAIDITANGTAPNVLGVLSKEIEQALQLLVQYFEQRDATEAYIEAAERVLAPIRVVRF